MSIPESTNIPDQATKAKSKLNLGQLWNMNLGFLGIQFGWGLQMANMSAIFEHLGADAEGLPILWLAAPLTGLLVQPIVGNLSDYTWTFLGRRRPYFLVGGILACLALFSLANCSQLWLAVVLLWVLDTSANVSMVPFRAFVGDLLPLEQRTQGFAMQSIMLGMGAVSASALPWFLSHVLAVDNTTSEMHKIPLTIEVAFYLGGILFLGTVLWTIVTTPEYPPQNLNTFEQLQATRGSIRSSLKHTWHTLGCLPLKMQQLARVQFFTWLGIFCFLLYFPPAVARNIFGAASENSLLYSEGIEWAGICFAVYNTICIAASFILPPLAKRFGRPLIHCLCLFCGGVSLISLLLVTNQYLLLLTMIGFGVAWSSALILPYAMLSSSIPPQSRGIYQGIFNFFIVLPEIVICLGFGGVMKYFLHDDRLLAVVMGGVFLLVAAGLTLLVESSSLDNLVDEVQTPQTDETITSTTRETISSNSQQQT